MTTVTDFGIDFRRIGPTVGERFPDVLLPDQHGHAVDLHQARGNRRALPMQGVILTREGEVGTWTAAGVGRFTGQDTAVSFRGAVYFQTAPPQLARLTQVAVLYEWEIDANGNAQTPFWEWK